MRVALLGTREDEAAGLICAVARLSRGLPQPAVCAFTCEGLASTAADPLEERCRDREAGEETTRGDALERGGERGNSDSDAGNGRVPHSANWLIRRRHVGGCMQSPQSARNAEQYI